MRIVLTVIFVLFVRDSVRAQESPPVRPVDAIPHYVEYGNIRFRDEKAMLDHWASQFRLDPDNVIYIFAYAGQVACAGEADARAMRARNYLVKRQGVSADRVIWKDGGFRSRLSVELWLRTRAETPPVPTPTVDPAEVELNDCEPKKRRRRAKVLGRA